MSPEDFLRTLTQSGVNFFTGVPDSILRDFCTLVNQLNPPHHVTAANEGTAVSLAIGHYLGTRSTPAVYLQNSGLGNALNPIISLAHKSVYQIPILLIIGWRGEPGLKDEPQHQAQGSITIPLLDICGVPYKILSGETSQKEIQEFIRTSSNAKSGPFAILISKGGISTENIEVKNQIETSLTRKSAIQVISRCIRSIDIIVATTGKISRELLVVRESDTKSHADFLCVGGMGHASSIATGLAISNLNRRVFCLDGDGALQMHLGSAATIGELSPKNFFHFVFNNGTHDSVGGNPVTSPRLNYQKLFKAFGYQNQFLATNGAEIESAISYCNQNDGPVLIEVKIEGGQEENLPRPTNSPLTSVRNFQEMLHNE